MRKISQAVERVQSEMTGLAAKAATAWSRMRPLLCAITTMWPSAVWPWKSPTALWKASGSWTGVYDAFVAQKYDVPADMTAAGAAVSDPTMYATKETFGSAMTWETLGYTGQGCGLPSLIRA